MIITFPLASAEHRVENREREIAHNTYQNIDAMWNVGSVCGEILMSWTQMACCSSPVLLLESLPRRWLGSVPSRYICDPRVTADCTVQVLTKDIQFTSKAHCPLLCVKFIVHNKSPSPPSFKYSSSSTRVWWVLVEYCAILGMWKV